VRDLFFCWIRSGRIESVAGRIAGLYHGGTTVIGSDGRQNAPFYRNYSMSLVELHSTA